MKKLKRDESGTIEYDEQFKQVTEKRCLLREASLLLNVKLRLFWIYINLGTLLQLYESTIVEVLLTYKFTL